jgi:hypothetical protein
MDDVKANPALLGMCNVDDPYAPCVPQGTFNGVNYGDGGAYESLCKQWVYEAPGRLCCAGY